MRAGTGAFRISKQPGLYNFIPVSEANAHLIAAAPEMLETLIEVDRILTHGADSWDDILNRIAHVIATARGKS